MGNASGIKVYSKKVLEFVMELLEVAMYFFSCTGNYLLRKFECLLNTVVPNFSPIGLKNDSTIFLFIFNFKNMVETLGDSLTIGTSVEMKVIYCCINWKG